MKRFTRILSLIFTVAVFVLYARCLCFVHIGLDDAAYTFRNPFVADGLSFANVAEAFMNLRHGGIWMPVTYVSYMLDASICRLTGLPLLGEMHFVSVLLHVVNFLLLWKLLSLLLPASPHRPPPTAQQLTTNDPRLTTNDQRLTFFVAFAAMVWAIHPLRVEPVAWIAGRKELLWSLFALSGLICWIKGWERGMGDEGGRLDSHPSTLTPQLSSLLFCALACLSKPTAMCFPFLLLLVTWWMKNQKPETRNHPASTIYPLSLVACHLIIAAATAVLAAYSQTHVAGREVSSLYAAPLAHRLVNALSAVGYYIRATFWPFGLHIDCRAVPGLWPLDAGWNFLALGLAVVAAFVCHFIFSSSICFARPDEIKVTAHNDPTSPHPSPLSSIHSSLSTLHSPLFFAIFWFLIPLVPTLGIFGSFGMEAHADRFTYLPSMAFSFLIATFAKRLTTSHQPRTASRYPRTTVIGHQASIIFLSVVTFLQLSYWRDDAAAHLRALACDPEHPRAMVHVADARCSRQRNFDGGIRLYRQALARADAVPKGGFDVEDVTAKLAYALATRGREEDFAEVRRLGAAVLHDTRLDRRGLMLDALGTAFLHDGDLERAASLFKASLAAPDRFWPKASTQRKLESVNGN